MADDSVFVLHRGDQRDRRGVRGVQQLNQTGFDFATFERALMQFVDGRSIVYAARTDALAHYCSFPKKCTAVSATLRRWVQKVVWPLRRR